MLVPHGPRSRRSSEPGDTATTFLTPSVGLARDDPGVTDDDTQPAEFLLDSFPPGIRATGLALRSLIFRAIPDAVETVRTGWRWIAYSLPEKGKVRNFAWIGPELKHIHLGFENGTLLADPEHILQGAQERLKKFRYFTFEPEIDIDEGVLVDYLRRSAELAVLPSAVRRALAERAATIVAGEIADVPPDWELVATTPVTPGTPGTPGTNKKPTARPQPRPRSAPSTR